jgi:hypothetical protein
VVTPASVARVGAGVPFVGALVGTFLSRSKKIDQTCVSIDSEYSNP